MSTPRLEGFFSSHSDADEFVSIRVEPEVVYLEVLRDRLALNFDFVVENRSDDDLQLRFIKAAMIDSNGDLVSYRYLNRNAVGPSGLDTLCVSTIQAGATVDLYNPFHELPADLDIAAIQYTFTFVNLTDGAEMYCGKIRILPEIYTQRVDLRVPMRGLLTVMDSHDYRSHHRRFSMNLIRQVTQGLFAENFSRFGIDFSVVGNDGNLARMTSDEHAMNYDFRFTDIRQSYSDGATIFAPGAGEVVAVTNDLEDMYDQPFDTERAIRDGRIADIAGNRVIIRHNEHEYSHLFHFMRDSILVSVGESVESGQPLGRVGFSGTATVYSHLHYQLMNGSDFLRARSLPVQFSNVTLVRGKRRVHHDRVALETGDFLLI